MRAAMKALANVHGITFSFMKSIGKYVQKLVMSFFNGIKRIRLCMSKISKIQRFITRFTIHNTHSLI